MNTFKSKLLLPLILILCFSCATKKDEGPSRIILVSIAPYKFFVEKIAGDTVSVQQIVPTGSSPHSFEPTSRSILKASRADAWFRIGESFEKRAKQAMLSHNEKMQVVDLREGINTIHAHHEGHGHQCQHEDCRDPHIWLSPREGKKQARIIYETLTELYPENAEQYRKALRKFEKELDDLDLELEQILLPLKGKTILVSHPALAYMGRDYNFTQLSIEFEGKEPSPKQLTKLLEMGRQLNTDRIFIQEQHLSKGARLVANELDADVVEINPLSENYIENIRFIARSIAGRPQR